MIYQKFNLDFKYLNMIYLDGRSDKTNINV